MRPLGIDSYKDKIMQLAVKKILEAIYDPRFLGLYIKDTNLLWLINKYLKAGGVITDSVYGDSEESSAQDISSAR